MKEGYTSEGYLVSKRYAYYVFVVLFVIYMIDYVDRYVVSGVVPYLKASVEAGGLGLSDTQCGLMMSVIYWSMIILTFPFSILLDRWKRAKSLGVMVLLWSFATGVCAFTKSFPQLLSARVAVGVGEAGYVPGGYNLIAAYFPEKKRDLIIGIWNAAIPLGVVGGTILGGIIGVRYGWRHAFGIMAIPGLDPGGPLFPDEGLQDRQAPEDRGRRDGGQKDRDEGGRHRQGFPPHPVAPVYLSRLRRVRLCHQRPDVLAPLLLQPHRGARHGQGVDEVVDRLPAGHRRRPARRVIDQHAAEEAQERPARVSDGQLPGLRGDSSLRPSTCSRAASSTISSWRWG